jgi:vacuolar-type H+-ATPase subunit I/STV1
MKQVYFETAALAAVWGTIVLFLTAASIHAGHIMLALMMSVMGVFGVCAVVIGMMWDAYDQSVKTDGIKEE